MAKVAAGTPDPESGLREAIYAAIASYLDIDVAELRGDLALGEIRLDGVEMLMALETGLAFDFSDEAIESVNTLDDLVREAERAPRRLPPNATIQRWTLN